MPDIILKARLLGTFGQSPAFGLFALQFLTTCLKRNMSFKKRIHSIGKPWVISPKLMDFCSQKSELRVNNGSKIWSGFQKFVFREKGNFYEAIGNPVQQHAGNKEVRLWRVRTNGRKDLQAEWIKRDGHNSPAFFGHLDGLSKILFRVDFRSAQVLVSH